MLGQKWEKGVGIKRELARKPCHSLFLLPFLLLSLFTSNIFSFNLELQGRDRWLELGGFWRKLGGLVGGSSFSFSSSNSSIWIKASSLIISLIGKFPPRILIIGKFGVFPFNCSPWNAHFWVKARKKTLHFRRGFLRNPVVCVSCRFLWGFG